MKNEYVMMKKLKMTRASYYMQTRTLSQHESIMIIEAGFAVEASITEVEVVGGLMVIITTTLQEMHQE